MYFSVSIKVPILYTIFGSVILWQTKIKYRILQRNIFMLKEIKKKMYLWHLPTYYTYTNIDPYRLPLGGFEGVGRCSKRTIDAMMSKG